MNRRFSTIFGLLFATLILVQATNSQVILPPDEEDPKPRILIDMSRANRMAAQDYQDLTERLEKTAYDYQSYFSEYTNLYAKKYQMLLQKLIFKINDGVYSEDMERLSDDLVELTETLADDEDDVQDAGNNRKLYRLMRGLEHELEMFNDELVEDIIDRVVEEEISREEIQEYLEAHREEMEEAREIIKETMAEYKELLQELQRVRVDVSDEHITLDKEQLQALEELTRLSEELAKLATISIDTVSLNFHDVPGFQEIPVPPQPPVVVIGPSNRSYRIETGGAGVTKEFVDSLKVTSKSTPIFINSETGDLRVTGWDKPMVVAMFDVEIVAENEKTAKKFTDEISVKLFSNKDGVYLTSHFPNLSDPKRKIVRSTLNIRVPYANSLVCENSFGKIDLVRVEGGVKMSTDHCDVNLESVAGRIDIVNSYGQVTVADCESEITVVNSQGPITVYGCRGKFDIDNSYAEVEASENTGPLVIRNSGKVMVSDHRGRVDITNSNGIVEVTDVIGDLVVDNSYKPLTVSDIEGTVDIRNQNSPVEAHDIRGALHIFNQYGVIKSSDVSGPIEFTSENGKVVLVAEDRLRGPSFIRTKLGKIELLLSQESDVLVTAKVEGGVIEAPRKAVASKKGETTTVEVAFGRGDNKLEVTGDYTSVTIADTH